MTWYLEEGESKDVTRCIEEGKDMTQCLEEGEGKDVTQCFRGR